MQEKQNRWSKRPVTELKFGDIIGIWAPYEENTPDYYNGYDPLYIKGEYVTDNFGRTAKFRPVMVVGVSDEELHYIAITHRTSYKGGRYQYEMQSTYLGTSYDTSYAECANVRCIPVKPYWAFPQFGVTSAEDIRNIKQKFIENISYIPHERDYRKFVPDIAREIVMNTYDELGYERTRTADSWKFNKGTEEHTLYDNGVLYHHYYKPIQQVQEEHGYGPIVETIMKLIEDGELNNDIQGIIT